MNISQRLNIFEFFLNIKQLFGDTILLMCNKNLLKVSKKNKTEDISTTIFDTSN